MVNLIFVQLETTGFDPSRDQVVIIAAEESETGATFSRRIIPSVSIKPEARERNGLSVINGVLYYGYDPMYANIVSRRKAWIDFIDFISAYSEPLLIGYQIHEQFVRRELHCVDLVDRFERVLAGRIRFVDMTNIFKEADPESNGELSLVARRHLDGTMDTGDLFPLPMYRLQLVRGLLDVLGISVAMIEQHAQHAC